LSKRRSLFVALSGVFAAVLGTLWWRQRGVPTPIADPAHTAAEALPVEAAAPQIAAVETPAPAIPQWVVLTLRLVSAVFGLLCLVQMQGLLLASRLPFAPLGLFVLGIALLLPLAANHTPQQAAITLEAPSTETKPLPSNRMRRAFYFAAALFFVFVSLVIAQFGRFSLLLVLVWLLGIIAILSATLTLKIDWRALIQQRQMLQSLALDAAIMLLMQVLLGLLLRLTFSPLSLMPMQDIDLRIMDMLAEGQVPDYYVETTPFYLSLENAIAGPTRELADMQRFSGMFALTIVPAVYFFARVTAGRWTGLFAAGFAAVGLWTLALAKSGTVYPALAMCSAVYLGILFINPPRLQDNSEEDVKRAKYVLAGIVLGIGWLIAPDFGYMALLLPIRSLVGFLGVLANGFSLFRLVDSTSYSRQRL
jgi:hypothetical protein